MQAALVREILDTDEISAVGLSGQHDAGIDGRIDQAIPDPATQHDRAGATVPFGATFLGPGGSLMETEIVEKREVGGGLAETNHGATPHELNMTAHDRLAPFDLGRILGRIPKPPHDRPNSTTAKVWKNGISRPLKWHCAQPLKDCPGKPYETSDCLGGKWNSDNYAIPLHSDSDKASVNALLDCDFHRGEPFRCAKFVALLSHQQKNIKPANGMNIF